MTNNIIKIGVVNYHTYLHDEIVLNGNAIAFRADNGVGKTALMTALYPTILTMDLQNSLNFGNKINRKPSDFVKHQTYIYMTIKQENGEPMTLLLSFKKRSNNTIENEAVVFDGLDTLQFFKVDSSIIPISELKKIYKDFISQTFSTQKSYKEWVARELFGISRPKFDSKIRIENKISSPSINMNDKKYHVDELIQEIKNGFLSITDIDGVNDNIQNYAQSLLNYHEEKIILENKTTLLQYLAKKRSDLSLDNQNALEKADKIRMEMNGYVQKLESKRDDISEKLEQIKENIATNECALDKNKSDKITCNEQLKEIEFQLNKIESNIREKTNAYQALEKTLHEKQKVQQQKEKDLHQLTTDINEQEKLIEKLNYEMQQENIPDPLPFQSEEWDEIKGRAQQYQNAIERQNQLTQELKQKEKEDIALKEEIEMLMARHKHEVETYHTAKQQYYQACQEEPRLGETLEDYQQRAFKNAHTQKAENEQNIKEIENKLKQIRTEMDLHHELKDEFVATNAIPLYRVIDFKENITEEEQNRIESYLKHSGLLELIITADTIDKGVTVCDTH